MEKKDEYSLQLENEKLRAEIELLKEKIRDLQSTQDHHHSNNHLDKSTYSPSSLPLTASAEASSPAPSYPINSWENDPNKTGHDLTFEEIRRYARHALVPNFRVGGQHHLKHTSVIIIGAGGLGCPIALYLAAAGVGRIGIVDDDLVEISNLQRQVVHREEDLGRPKALSVRDACLRLNSSIEVKGFVCRIEKKNAREIIGDYRIIVDASDNVPTRYLLSDCSVFFSNELGPRPLVSGAALKFEGQVTVYSANRMDRETPCYRCLFPNPPPNTTVTNCADGGIIGTVTGIIGTIQAHQVIILAKYYNDLKPIEASLSESSENSDNLTCLTRRMILFDGSSSDFRVVRIRGKSKNCVVCSPENKDKQVFLFDQLSNDYYQTFCSAPNHDRPVVNDSSIDKDNTNNEKNPVPLDAAAYAAVKARSLHGVVASIEPLNFYINYYNNINKINDDKSVSCLIDVRDPVQFEICALKHSINFPLSAFKSFQGVQIIPHILQLVHNYNKRNGISDENDDVPQIKFLKIFFVCRRGVDSIFATKFFKDIFNSTGADSSLDLSVEAFNILGGLVKWGNTVDKQFPVY